MSDFMLLAWIKREQEEIRNHKEKMAIKNYSEDTIYVNHLSHLVGDAWPKMKLRDRQFICTLMRWRTQEKRNFTPSQRSAIMSMYMRYMLND